MAWPNGIGLSSPGLRWRRRKGLVVAYWICRPDIIRLGYPVRCQRLWCGTDKPTDLEMNEIRAHCHRLQSEMKDWGKNPNAKRSPAFWNKRGEIYFVQSGSAVKIGFGQSAPKRLSGLQTSSPDKLVLLGHIPGNRHIERFLHWQFRNLRIRGEWFKLEGELTRWIAENLSPEPTGNGSWGTPKSSIEMNQ